jgi:hypothetical protein
MDEKNEKAVKNRFSQARRSYGERCGLVRRWPPATFKSDFSSARSNLVAKQSRQGSRGGHAWHSYQLSFVAETTWSPKWGKFTRKWPKSPKKGPLGARQLTPKWSKMSKFQNCPNSAVDSSF